MRTKYLEKNKNRSRALRWDNGMLSLPLMEDEYVYQGMHIFVL